MVGNSDSKAQWQLLVHNHRKHPELVNSCTLHQDNTPYKAHWVTEFLEEHNFEVMEQPHPLPPFRPYPSISGYSQP